MYKTTAAFSVMKGNWVCVLIWSVSVKISIFWFQSATEHMRMILQKDNVDQLKLGFKMLESVCACVCLCYLTAHSPVYAAEPPVWWYNQTVLDLDHNSVDENITLLHLGSSLHTWTENEKERKEYRKRRWERENIGRVGVHFTGVVLSVWVLVTCAVWSIQCVWVCVCVTCAVWSVQCEGTLVLFFLCLFLFSPHMAEGRESRSSPPTLHTHIQQMRTVEYSLDPRTILILELHWGHENCTEDHRALISILEYSRSAPSLPRARKNILELHWGS